MSILTTHKAAPLDCAKVQLGELGIPNQGLVSPLTDWGELNRGHCG
jgi:hypothetical protein